MGGTVFLEPGCPPFPVLDLRAWLDRFRADAEEPKAEVKDEKSEVKEEKPEVKDEPMEPKDPKPGFILAPSSRWIFLKAAKAKTKSGEAVLILREAFETRRPRSAGSWNPPGRGWNMFSWYEWEIRMDEAFIGCRVQVKLVQCD